jgi:penicillin amidase
VIPVKGRAQPWVEEVLLTSRHGPLVTPTASFPDEHRPLALRSMVLEGAETAAPLLALNRATNWEEFRAALSRWSTPSLSVLYADVEGNIGFQMTGAIPVRGRGEGLVPSPGWSGQYEWTGVVPSDDLPRAFNPPDGLWANGNQNIAKYNPHFYTREFDSHARYQRIRQVLESKQRHSAVDFGALHADEVTLPGRELVGLLIQHLNAEAGLEARALDQLRGWDGRMSADSVAATIYAVFRNELVRARYGEAAGELLPALFGTGPHPLLGAESSWYFLQTSRALGYVREWAADRANGSAPPASDAVIRRAFSETVRSLRRQLGPDPSAWLWGRVHTLSLQHALTIRKPLGMIFDAPTFAWSGDLETVRAGGSGPSTLEAQGPISAYRFIADCADWDATLSCLPGGQSGHRGSPHYLDQLDAWRRVAYHPLAFTRPAIARVARHTLHLLPQ